MKNYNNSIDEHIERLSIKHNSFSNYDIKSKKNLASQVLKKIQNEKWCYMNNWMEKNAKLEKLDQFNSDKTKQLTAMMRFTFGSIAKSWLTSFINGVNVTYEKTDSNNFISKPCSIGLNAPGINFQLFCEKNINITAYEEKCEKGTVCLILGAGNQNFLTLIDIFQRVFIFNECVLVKHHPLRQFLYEPYNFILKPLIDENIVFLINDYGVEFSKKIIKNPFINHIHFTGSENTFKSIQKTLNNENKVCNVTAELGCVTPWIIFPGKFSLKEIKNVAKQLVYAKKSNGGSNCITPQVLILPEKWDQKKLLLDNIIKEINIQQTVPCYYPNSIENKNKIMTNYKKEDIDFIYSLNKLKNVNKNDEIVIINYGLIRDKTKNSICLKTEVFGPLLVIANIENNNINDYVDNIISTLNSEEIYGSLSCSLFCPNDMPNELIDKCIHKIEYGTIAINIWSLFGYTASTLGGTWGGYYKNLQSGRGRIGNLSNNKYVSKTVIKNTSLENMQIDLSQPPSTFVLDLLFKLTIKTNNVLDVIKEFVIFLFSSIMKSFNSLFFSNNMKT